MTADGRRPGEFELIAALFAPLTAGAPEALGLRDDAAVLPQRAGAATVVTTDTMVAGVHFLAAENPGLVGGRLLRVNLSDLAAMGADPRAVFLNLSIPTDLDQDWLVAFAAGLGDDLAHFGVPLIGGDTTRTPGTLTLTLTAIGELPEGSAVTRSGARAGDHLFVSGTLGDAALGLRVLQGEDGLADPGYLLARFQSPAPRLLLGAALRGVASAMADVSDGLIADAGHICAASGVAARIEAAALPLSASARGAVEAGRATIAGLAAAGDDYELVFTVAPERRDEAEAAASAAATPITRIGEIHDGDGARLIGADGTELAVDVTGYRHF